MGIETVLLLIAFCLISLSINYVMLIINYVTLTLTRNIISKSDMVYSVVSSCLCLTYCTGSVGIFIILRCLLSVMWPVSRQTSILKSLSTRKDICLQIMMIGICWMLIAFNHFSHCIAVDVYFFTLRHIIYTHTLCLEKVALPTIYFVNNNF